MKTGSIVSPFFYARLFHALRVPGKKLLAMRGNVDCTDGGQVDAMPPDAFHQVF
jgi:hypothetical protein